MWGAELKVQANIWGATRRAALCCWPNASPCGHQPSSSDMCRHGQGQPSSPLLPAAAAPDIGDAEDNCPTLQACCHTWEGEGPGKFPGWDQKCIVCRQGLRERAVRNTQVWRHLGMVTWRALARADTHPQQHGDSTHPL